MQLIFLTILAMSREWWGVQLGLTRRARASELSAALAAETEAFSRERLAREAAATTAEVHRASLEKLGRPMAEAGAEGGISK